MRESMENNRDVTQKRKELAEPPYGTIKRAYNQGHLLLKRLPKVGAEISLTLLAYDITRVINIVGVEKLMAEMTTVKGNSFY